MQDTWNRLHTWFRKNAPDVLKVLRPGASESEIRETEQFLGITFPEDMRASYLIHNGQWSYFRDRMWRCDFSFIPAPYTREFLSLERMRTEWTYLTEDLRDGIFEDEEVEVDEEIQAAWWSPCWIPVSAGDFRDLHCADLHPTSEGIVGQIINVYCGSADKCRNVEAMSFRSWLEKITDGLQTGKYVIQQGHGIVDMTS
jgi:cell wall assembly regulator SMI1